MPIDHITLRTASSALAQDGLTNCGDRVVLTLNQIDMAIINHRAEHGHYSQADLFAMRRGMFRLGVLQDIARDIILVLQQRRALPLNSIDEIEVALTYQTLLGAELELPGGRSGDTVPGRLPSAACRP